MEIIRFSSHILLRRHKEGSDNPRDQVAARLARNSSTAPSLQLSFPLGHTELIQQVTLGKSCEQLGSHVSSPSCLGKARGKGSHVEILRDLFYGLIKAALAYFC